MSNDFVLFKQNSNDLSKLVYIVFSMYKPLIIKQGAIFSSHTKRRVLVEDFLSEAFIYLYYFLGRIKEEKIKDTEKFSFYCCVVYACDRVMTKYKNVLQEAPLDIDFDCSCSKYCVSEMNIAYEQFLESLSKRQRQIIEDRQNGVHETITRSNLKISHGTYVSEMKKAKELFMSYI